MTRGEHEAAENDAEDISVGGLRDLERSTSSNASSVAGPRRVPRPKPPVPLLPALP